MLSIHFLFLFALKIVKSSLYCSQKSRRVCLHQGCLGFFVILTQLSSKFHKFALRKGTPFFHFKSITTVSNASLKK